MDIPEPDKHERRAASQGNFGAVASRRTVWVLSLLNIGVSRSAAIGRHLRTRERAARLGSRTARDRGGAQAA